MKELLIKIKVDVFGYCLFNILWGCAFPMICLVFLVLLLQVLLDFRIVAVVFENV